MRDTQWDACPIKLKTFQDDDGTLCPVEYHDILIAPKRTFYVTGVPKGMERGHHAHYKTEQLLICLQGQILVKLHNGISQTQHLLNPHHAIYVHKMIWDSQVFLTGSDILLVLCDTIYDKSDYIEDFKEFCGIVQ